ncbi:MAG: hypothetical protein LBM68_05470 [Bacteroidales bacterium]|jgi:hypothetical protein|nr:hypothetical protein [Bacteroidales bacterium]
MKVIYSYNSYGGKNIPGAWWLRMAELSVGSMRKNTNYPVELYCDAESEAVFTGENFGAQFDKVHVVDFMHYPHHIAYWNFGKLLVYSLQEEPFLHVDFDTYFKRGFTIPEGAIVTECARDYTFVRGFKEAAILPIDQIPEKLICSGLLGGSAYFAYRELFDFAKKQCQTSPHESRAMEYLIGVEEFNLSQIADFYGLQAVELAKDSFLHFQGANKRERYDGIICDLYYITFGKSLHR